MPTRKPTTFHTIDELISNFPYLERKETMALFKQVRALKGKMNMSTLKKICYFKTPRSQAKVAANAPRDVAKIFDALKAIKGDRERCRKLCELKGVRIPTASAILMFMNPGRYPIIDIRVWNVLAEFKVVKAKNKWVSFGISDWGKYLSVVRAIATKHQVTPRHVDKVLYSWHVLQYQLTRE